MAKQERSGYQGLRRDTKRRILRFGESQRKDGKYLFKYMVDGKPKFLMSWRLEPTDKQPAGTKPTPSLRELEKQLGKDLESQLDPQNIKMTVKDLVERYLDTKVGVKPNTLTNYNFIKNVLSKEAFYGRNIRQIRTSDAKLFLIKLQKDGKGSSTVKSVRGVLRPTFQLAVDDDLLVKNPFDFQLLGVIINTEKTREAITRQQMNDFLKFVRNDNVYCKYYEVFYILFHTGLRISEFCGLTIRDLDMENKIISIDHQH